MKCPNPFIRRENTICLDGAWLYSVYGKNGEKVYENTIMVPFCPESVRSGVKRRTESFERMEYTKSVRIDRKKDKRYILTFLASDSSSCLFINGKAVSEHDCGYLPFTSDITSFFEGDSFEIKLVVKDELLENEKPRGKQSVKPHRIWYERTSGIYMSVFLEEVEKSYVSSIFYTPLEDLSGVRVLAVTNDGEIKKARVTVGGKNYEIKTNSASVIRPDEIRLWSPDDPYLYFLRIKAGEDEFDSYFALRKIEIKEDEKGMKRLFLNGNNCFCHGILNQGYYPDALLTGCEEDFILDIRKAKSMGFNMMRIHIKIENPLFYYHADREGMLIWQDFVNGGGKYNSALITLPVFVPLRIKDNHYRLLSRMDENERNAFITFCQNTVLHLYNHPSIIEWTIFNEGWGQFDSSKITEIIKRTDSKRLIDSASGWFDQGFGDFESHHVYFRRFKAKPRKRSRALALTEYGGYGLDLSGRKMTFSYKKIKDSKSLEREFIKGVRESVKANIKNGLVASVYTQLCDVEGEKNGLLDENHEMKVNPEALRKSAEELIKC